MAYALVTGASRGIGQAIATELARRGYSLLLTARSEDALEKVAAQLRQQHGVQAHVLALDLAAPDAAARLAAWATSQAQDLAVLVNNAGYGLWGRFEELSLEEQQNMLQINMMVPVALTHALLPSLRRQPKAYVLNVASTAAYQAVPTLTLYAASKAFLLSFTRGLRYELRDSPVSVTCLSPGATTTDFANRAGMSAGLQEVSNKVSMTPEQVAKAAVTALFAGEAELIPGALNKISATLTGFVPKAVTEKIAAGIYEKHLK
ncbi:SDR family NAD(P)-dependent oxidoreductase [Hymenobacter sp. BT491]|uniref:SDR family NAD(P)-dependent oxidoreductase n=1 Tax=Hymenobacter sp. BT491 TaxID=2766779 RepID=UPI001653AD14|nr:SDR family oxidoreductase [Hymenobacter sp. BT491]MBC6991265.1 SDR family oxidoreductase [Hymenobacter sp. BT491]